MKHSHIWGLDPGAGRLAVVKLWLQVHWVEQLAQQMETVFMAR